MTFSELLLNIGSLAFVFIAVGFCIFSHELGHFLAAKWRGLHIDAFSLGFRPIWKKKVNGVEYRIGWLPFGGYVELPQVDATDATPKAADGTELPRAKAIDRIITAVAGPLFNILSGLLIACFVWYVGMPQDTPKMREITVMEVEPGSPEYQAGLRPGDKIVKLNGEPFFSTWSNFVSKILFAIGKVDLEVIRDGKPVTVSYVPVDNPKAPGSLGAEKIAWPFFTPLIPLELTPEKGSVAEKAGIKPGDYIVAIDGTPVQDYAEFQSGLDQAGSRPVRLTLRRGGKNFDVTVTPEPIKDLGPEFSRYLTGIQLGPKADRPGIYIHAVMPDSNALAAGLRKDDRLVAINGKPITDPAVLIDTVQELKTAPFQLTVERDGKQETRELSARLITPHTIGATIASLDHPTPFQQFISTIDMSYKSLRGILVRFGNQLGLTDQTSTLKPTHMSGPLGIGMVLFNSVRYSSFIHGIYFIVIISFALAIFNLLPLPVLDGGHITFGFIEIIFRKPLPTVVIKTLSMIFVTLLIGLMVFVTFSDGRRLWRSIAPPPGEEQQAVPSAPAATSNPSPEKTDAAAAP